jgi:dihydroneopterin aldolase
MAALMISDANLSRAEPQPSAALTNRELRGYGPAMLSAVPDEILIEGLALRGKHGWFEHEREVGCSFSVDVVLRFDTRAAATSDRLSQTIDYGAVSAEIKRVFDGESVHLIERLAAQVCDRLLERFPARSIGLTLRKLAPPIEGAPQAVGVRVERARSEVQA